MNKLNCDENSLREFFTSRSAAGAFVLEAIASGMSVVVQMNDGTTLTLSHKDEALRALAEYFGWLPE